MSAVMERHDSVHEKPEDLAVKPINALTRSRYAYITLLTRANYLAGVVLLAHTLKQHGSQYPLIVLYTPSLTPTAVHALELESPSSNLILEQCDLLIPSEHHKLNVAVERFTDTWTKLRVFEQFDEGFDTICYLDADMIIRKNMDFIFDHAEGLPHDWIAAVHDCVCNPNPMPWTPKGHNKENCPLTPQVHPMALTRPMPVKPYARPTYQLFNSGMFLYHPSRGLWDSMLHLFNTTDLLSTFKFPDQEFMAHFFRDRWMSVSWKYNAVKTMAYRHKNLWRADEIVCLHYIVDKPWAKRIGYDGIAGFRGQDGETHSWWWDDYEAWCETRLTKRETEVVVILNKHVARRDSEASDDARPDMGAIGAKVHGLTD